LEDVLVDSSEVLVYRFFRFFSSFQERPKRFMLSEFPKMRYTSPSRPLVITPVEGFSSFGVFPKKTFLRAEFHLEPVEESFDLRDHIYVGYVFETTLLPEDIDRMYFAFKIPRSLFEEYEDFSFFGLRNESWEELTFSPVHEDEEFYYYAGFVDPLEGVVFAGNKNGFLGLF